MLTVTGILKFCKLSIFHMAIAMCSYLFTPYELYSQVQNNFKGFESNSNTYFELNAENEFCSKYIFRGLTVEDNFVYQPALYLWYGKEDAVNKIGTGVWFNFRMPHKNISNENSDIENSSLISDNTKSIYKPFNLSETDLYLMHQAAIYDLTLKNTAAVYLFSGEEFENTAEYIFNASYSLHERVTGSELIIGSEFACDIYASPGALIITHSLSFEKNITEFLSLNTSFNLVWASAKYNYVNADINKSALNSAGTELNVTYSPSEIFYAKLRCQYNRYIDGLIAEEHGKSSSFLGITAGFNF